jgi:hypothetical protein
LLPLQPKYSEKGSPTTPWKVGHFQPTHKRIGLLFNKFGRGGIG